MWRSKSRETYACRLTFDLPKFLFEINDHVTQFVRKPTFDPLQSNRKLSGHEIDNLFENSLISPSLNWTGKVILRSVWNRIKSFQTNWVTWSLLLKRTWGPSKVRQRAYASRDYLLHILNWMKSLTPRTLSIIERVKICKKNNL